MASSRKRKLYLRDPNVDVPRRTMFRYLRHSTPNLSECASDSEVDDGMSFGSFTDISECDTSSDEGIEAYFLT